MIVEQLINMLHECNGMIRMIREPCGTDVGEQRQHTFECENRVGTEYSTVTVAHTECTVLAWIALNVCMRESVCVYVGIACMSVCM